MFLSSLGSLRKRMRGHRLLSVHSAAQRLATSVLSGADSKMDASSTCGVLDRAAAVSWRRAFKTEHIGYLHIVVGGVGEGGGARDSDLVSLK